MAKALTDPSHTAGSTERHFLPFPEVELYEKKSDSFMATARIASCERRLALSRRVQ